ncbi:MAG: squalene--hopene cyclase, partial [Candidatus Eremiobacteraeota bacterium]|nr:squalene--hopene cyclase [Candidatus Eremiobacteraeota bacterium]
TASSCVKKAIRYLKQSQEPEGCWYGRWGVNYLYGTWQVLKGLSCIGEDMQEPYIRKAIDWIYSVQNSDGGWGESCHTYEDYKLHAPEITKSTPSQTAWALMALMAGGDYESSAFIKGMRWLTSKQNEEDTWEENLFTGTGFPKVFYLKYHLYRHYFPLFAFGMYLKKMVSQTEENKTEELDLYTPAFDNLSSKVLELLKEA